MKSHDNCLSIKKVPLRLMVLGDLARRTKVFELVSRFMKDQSGATAIEYGLIAAGIAAAIIAVVNGLGTQLNSTFSSISSQLK